MESRKFLSDEMNRLRQDILAMSIRVEENLGKALTALKTRNSELAKEVRADDSEVDALQMRIEDDAAMIIATQHPVARDLREMVAIFKITSNIERVGDHAVHLSRAAKKLAKSDVSFGAQDHLEKMAKTGQQMLRAAISAFMEQNAQAARDAAAMDDKIDKEHKELTEEVLKIMKKKKTDFVKGALQILQTSNQIERLGDHITNICEAVIYMIEGRREELNE